MSQLECIQAPVSVTPAAEKVAISLRIRSEASTNGTASRAPVASPSRMSRSSKGRIPRWRKDDLMARLGRSVGGDAIIPHLRTKSHGDQGGGSRDEAVQHDRHLQRRGPQNQADQAGDLEAAELGQHVERIVALRSIRVDGPANHVYLVPPAALVDSRAAAGHIFRTRTGQHRGQGTGTGRVGNAHFADGEQAERTLWTQSGQATSMPMWIAFSAAAE